MWQVLDRSVELLGEMAVSGQGRDVLTEYPFKALCISEASLSDTLVSAGMQRYPRHVSTHWLCT